MPLICLFGIISNLDVGSTREGSIGLAHCTPAVPAEVAGTQEVPNTQLLDGEGMAILPNPVPKSVHSVFQRAEAGTWL